MKYEIIISIGLALVAIGLPLFTIFRRVLLVPEGFAGLLYQHGKFIELLAVGRHIRWGRGFSWAQVDLRKATMAVAGQEVLTADKRISPVQLRVRDPQSNQRSSGFHKPAASGAAPETATI